MRRTDVALIYSDRDSDHASGEGPFEKEAGQSCVGGVPKSGFESLALDGDIGFALPNEPVVDDTCRAEPSPTVGRFTSVTEASEKGEKQAGRIPGHRCTLAAPNFD